MSADAATAELAATYLLWFIPAMALQFALVSTGSALRAVGMGLLDDHVRHCVGDALASGDAGRATEKSQELLAAVQRFAKTT